ncbi:Aldo/keto reductase [Microthyrium microscopicum]|uniref:Aldo/keto reductase n=1 Tax=Microthyrium microscopicum TaxID=703497 RepID=A0A6A6UVN8_9PEZI|nr:Aldo/keto reductase [Microthyrium microscopicum]
MSPNTPVKIILGTHMVGDSSTHPGIAHFDNEKDVKALLDTFYNRGYSNIDTAGNYGASEKRLGQAGAASRFIIDTKVLDGQPGSHEYTKIGQSIKQSLDALKSNSVETLYLHVPDRQTPFEESAKAMNQAIEQGQCKRFGLSNYAPAEVQQFVDLCEEKGYAKPSVYQGHYNAIVRRGEKELFPVLRKNKIAFYAYSAGAGGLFSGHSHTSVRWSDSNAPGSLYKMLYGQQPVQDSVKIVRDAAQKHGISGHEAAIRWTAFHSILDGQYGDGVIIGMSKLAQLRDTLDAIKAGPLPSDLADAITAVYATVEGAEPPYHL